MSAFTGADSLGYRTWTGWSGHGVMFGHDSHRWLMITCLRPLTGVQLRALLWPRHIRARNSVLCKCFGLWRDLKPASRRFPCCRRRRTSEMYSGEVCPQLESLFLRKDEACAALGVSRRQFDRLMVPHGPIRVVKLGRRVLVDPEELRRFKASLQAESEVA